MNGTLYECNTGVWRCVTCVLQFKYAFARESNCYLSARTLGSCMSVMGLDIKVYIAKGRYSVWDELVHPICPTENIYMEIA